MAVTFSSQVCSVITIITCIRISMNEAGLLDAINILNTANSNNNQNTGHLPDNSLINLPSLINSNGNGLISYPALGGHNLLPNIGIRNPSQPNKEVAANLAESQKLLERLDKLDKQQEQERKKNATIEISKNSLQDNAKRPTGSQGVLKSMTKRRFYFQVKPVIPENEVTSHEETVFYLD